MAMFNGAAWERLCWTLMGSVSAIAVTAAGASAQEAAAAAAPAPAPAESAPQSAQLGEIVVTAQRRSERLQDVPVAVSAVTPESARKLGLRNVRDVQLTMPSTDLAQGNGFLQLYIRGIGQPFATPGLESPVSVYLDGMYLPRTGGFNSLLDLVDPGTIQVLRGPQGTLYGRNATGGVILLSSALPTDRFEGRVMGEYGRFDHKQLEGMLNLPLSDTFSARVAGRFVDEDGYISVPNSPKMPQVHNYTIRGTLRWQPTNNVDVIAGAEYQKSGPIQAAAELLVLGAPTCWLCTRTGVEPEKGFYKSMSNRTSPWRDSLFRAYLKGSVQIGDLEFTSLTSYFKDSINQEGEQDYTQTPAFFFHNRQGGKTFSQDIQVASSFSGPFNFLAGVTYLNDKPHIEISLLGDDFQFAQTATGTFPTSNNQITTKSIAAFLEANYKLTDNLKITVGGRYTHDKRTLEGENNPGFQLFGLPATFSGSKSFDAFTPRFVIAWDNRLTNVYYSYTRGFKAGGFATPAQSTSNAVGPEKMASHELGLKNTAFDGRLRTNIALFYYKNRGLQTQIIDPSGGGTVTQNAGAAEGYGAEFEFTAQATDNLTIGGSAGWLDAHYASYPNASQVCFDPTGTLNPSAPGATLRQCSADLSGARVPHAPRYQLSLNASYDFHIGSWSANIAGVTQYRSRFDFQPGAGGDLGLDLQKAYVITNLSAYVSPPGEKLRLGIYVDNAFDTKYATSRAANQPYGIVYTPGKPMTYGVRVEYKFD